MFDFETALGFTGFRLASNGAGPPRGHPTSNGHTLDGVPAGFGPVGYLVFTRSLTARRTPSVRGGEAPGRYLPKVPLSTRTL